MNQIPVQDESHALQEQAEQAHANHPWNPLPLIGRRQQMVESNPAGGYDNLELKRNVPNILSPIEKSMYNTL